MRLALGLAALLCASAPVFAGEWEQAFPSTAAASHLPDPAKVLVVGVGEQGEAAAADLVAALVGEAELVMDASALGDVSGLDDAAIAERAGAMPVSEVWIVRVFPGKSGPSAVITAYAEGDAAGGFSASAAAPVKPREGAGAGVSEATSATVAAVTSEAGPSADSSEKYLEDFVHFTDFTVIDANTGGVLGTGSIPMRGKYDEVLQGREFYDHIGETELGDRFQRRVTGKLTIIGVGAAVGTAGMVMSFTLPPGQRPFPVFCSITKEAWEYDQCLLEQQATERAIDRYDRSQTAWLGVSIATMSVGYLGMLSTLFYPTHPVELPEMKRLADEYNTRLAEELGLDPATVRSYTAPHPVLRGGVYADPLRGEAGMRFRVDF